MVREQVVAVVHEHFALQREAQRRARLERARGDAEFETRFLAVFHARGHERGDVAQVAEPGIGRERREGIEDDQAPLRRQCAIRQRRQAHGRRVAVAVQAALRPEVTVAIEQRDFQPREFQRGLARVVEQQVEVQVLRIARAFDERLRRQGLHAHGGPGREREGARRAAVTAREASACEGPDSGR